MISMIRLDERLIHGQVAVVWSRYLGVDRIVVANDEILNNETQIMALKMSVPAGIKAFFVSVDKAIALLNNPKSNDLKILVVIDNPKDALKIAEKVQNIPLINLGNYGRMNNPEGKEKRQLSKTIFVSEQDEQVLRQLIDTGVKVNIQPVPTDQDISLNEVL
ncbi:PTS sugar transporter subunit IIB [Enterococcus avium]|uniref:PTS sugar transporter subunit IIB n=1 Tax=Enterococcus avium TaxID=33945 RepID=UPI00379B4DC6